MKNYYLRKGNQITQKIKHQKKMISWMDLQNIYTTDK